MSVPIFERLMRRWQGSEPPADEATSPSAQTAEPDTITVDLASMLSSQFPAEYPAAEEAAESVLRAIEGVDLSTLARRSPALHGYDWTGYLRCSTARVVRVLRALSEHAPPGGRVLDLGAYFGNFSLALASRGYRVDAADAYESYGPAFVPCVATMRAAGITVHDSGDNGQGLQHLVGQCDAVVCAGVVEHIPHTPRLLLENATRLLKPGGILVIDTPNLAYLYHRLALAEGRSTFAPIATQFYTELPFEGHHREYTMDEVRWMLEASGHEVLLLDTFNYSFFAQSALTGEHAAYFRTMAQDPSLREIILAVSRTSSVPRGQ